MSGPGAGDNHKKGDTHVDHVKAAILKVSPDHGAQHNPESFNDSKEQAQLGEKPGPDVMINPANGLG